MLVKVRHDLAEDFSFSTNDGIQIDNDQVYSARYLEDEDDTFQVFINDSWHTIEGIDFEFLTSTFTLTDCKGCDMKEFYGDVEELQYIFNQQMNERDSTENDDFYEWCCKYVRQK